MINLSPASLPRRTELWESVLESLRHAIINGDLEPGTRLVEAELAKTLQVSRWPVRQAITRLEQENLVVKYPNRGAYVIEFSCDDIHEIYGLRRLLEGHAARLACQHMTSEYQEELRRLVAEIGQRVESGDMRGSAGPDMAFHRTIFLVAGSDRLLTMWEILIAPAHALLVQRNVAPSYRADAGGLPVAHAEIVDALCSDDPDLAERLMRQHLIGSEKTLLDAMRADDVFSATSE